MATVSAGNSAGARAHAVVMRRYGPPDVLIYEELFLPPLAPDAVRIRARRALPLSDASSAHAILERGGAEAASCSCRRSRWTGGRRPPADQWEGEVRDV